VAVVLRVRIGFVAADRHGHRKVELPQREDLPDLRNRTRALGLDVADDAASAGTWKLQFGISVGLHRHDDVVSVVGSEIVDEYVAVQQLAGVDRTVHLQIDSKINDDNKE